MQKRFEGTRVTVESFLAWKARFDAELGANKIQDREDKETRKLTGRELFLTDKTLNESDLKFLEDGKSLYLMSAVPPPQTHTIKSNPECRTNNNIWTDGWMALLN